MKGLTGPGVCPGDSGHTLRTPRMGCKSITGHNLTHTHTPIQTLQTSRDVIQFTINFFGLGEESRVSGGNREAWREHANSSLYMQDTICINLVGQLLALTSFIINCFIIGVKVSMVTQTPFVIETHILPLEGNRADLPIQ